MSIATLYVAGVAYTAFSVFGVGFTTLAALRRLGVLRTDSSAGHILSAVALAIYWPTLFLTAVVAFGVPFGAAAINLKLALDALIIAGGAAYGYRELAEIGRDLRRGGVLLFAAAGIVWGSWAFLQFPFVVDSGQLLWTQKFLTHAAPDSFSAMLGFSGLIVFLGSLFETLPLITTAAALKPLLALIACVTAYYAADSLVSKFRTTVAMLFIGLMAVSEFGTRGIAMYGKDSIYGILFSIAFMAVLCRPDAARRKAELGLYFAVAVAIGVITLPYMLVAYILWLILAPAEEKVSSTLPALFLVSFPLVPVSVAGFFQAGASVAFACFLALGLAGFGAKRLAPGIGPILLLGTARLRSVRAWIPSALLLPCIFLMPVETPVVAFASPDGTIIFESRPPLDGKMDFFAFLVEWRAHLVMLPLGVLAAASLGFFKIGRERAGLVAVCAMPFAVLLAMLIHANTGLPLLSNFNVWDIVKDTTLWYGGALFALLLVVLLATLATKVPAARAQSALLVLAGAGLVAGSANRIHVDELVRPLTYSRIGAYPSRDTAVAAEATWLELRGRLLQADMSLTVSRQSYHILSMYEAHMSVLNLAWLAKQSFPPSTRIGLLVGQDKIPEIRAFAQARRASITELARLENDEGLLLAVDFDDRGSVSLPGHTRRATVTDGAHGHEVWQRARFRWLREVAEVAVTLEPGDEVCLVLEMFTAGNAPRPEVVSVEAPGLPPLEIDLAESTITRPKRAAVRVVGEAGLARLKLKAKFSARLFPRDPRPIAYGLRQPIAVAAADRCRQ